IGLALLNFCLTWHNLYFVKDLIRQFALTMLLLPLVLGTASLVRREDGAAPEAPA
ncbi:MAG: hypothetical protein QOK47_1141, partial [Actinomycetota bacterium]|nr:hypothetical protein [Actinomycetota bacterium]